MAKNRFKQGSGCYKCRACGKQTRDTGEDEAGVGLCAFCYHMFGCENEHSDCKQDGMEDQHTKDTCRICNPDGYVKAICDTYHCQGPGGK